MKSNFTINFPKWRVEELNGYKPITTFWMDFSIADMYGIKAIKDTYRDVFEYAKMDYEYLTELVMVLNHKCNCHYCDKKMDLAVLYSDLYYKADEYALKNLKGEELRYFYQVTD